MAGRSFLITPVETMRRWRWSDSAQMTLIGHRTALQNVGRDNSADRSFATDEVVGNWLAAVHRELKMNPPHAGVAG